MIRLITIIIVNVLLLGAQAQAARPWNLQFEEMARFKARVVDVLCELTGDCPKNCGGGKRQLGLLKAGGTLHLAVKGVNDFAGAVNDLIPYCGKSIEVDGLLIKNPLATVYFLQRLRTGPDGKWIPATQFMKDWQTANPGIKGPWFRNDPLVKEIIKRDGVYGIPGSKKLKNEDVTLYPLSFFSLVCMEVFRNSSGLTPVVSLKKLKK